MKNVLVNIAVLISVSMLALVGCSSNTQSENTGVGAVAGAVIGGVAGSAFGAGTGQAVAVGIGAVAGALLGGYIGHSMDHSDNQTMCHTLDRNKTNHPSNWHNKKTGATYSMKPTSNVMSYNGNSYCRQYETTATISGKTQTVTGTACRQSNGSWRTVSQS
jgi:surface antigen